MDFSVARGECLNASFFVASGPEESREKTHTSKADMNDERGPASTASGHLLS
jgi:hypothetical protein